MEYLLSFIAASSTLSLALGLLYYRALYKKCKVQKENIRKNRHLFEDWGE
tara:strand:- start:229 stop:378 length:150 start_codon:yes stop_codon:yes gene_type:complete